MKNKDTLIPWWVNDVMPEAVVEQRVSFHHMLTISRRCIADAMKRNKDEKVSDGKRRGKQQGNGHVQEVQPDEKMNATLRLEPMDVEEIVMEIEDCVRLILEVPEIKNGSSVTDAFINSHEMSVDEFAKKLFKTIVPKEKRING